MAPEQQRDQNREQQARQTQTQAQEPTQARKVSKQTVELPDFDGAGNVVGTTTVDPAVGRELDQPTGTVPYIDPVKLNEVANAEASKAPLGVDDPDGPEAIRHFSGWQTHDFGGLPANRVDVVTYSPAKERARMAESGNEGKAT